MPRARNIKHQFFMNDELGELDPLARLLFIGLWTIADFNGNVEWRPKKIKTLLLPYDDCDITKLTINLDLSRFIRIYSNGEKVYLNIIKFHVHQRPHKNEVEKGTNIPEFTEEHHQVIDFTTLTINPDLIAINPEPIGANSPDPCILIPDTRSLNPDSPNRDKSRNLLFKEFWSIYPGPRKRDKPKAEILFTKQNQSTQELIINHIKHRSLNDPEWTKENGQFIPGPVPFLRQSGWTDEYRVNELSGFSDKAQESIRNIRDYIDEHPNAS